MSMPNAQHPGSGPSDRSAACRPAAALPARQALGLLLLAGWAGVAGAAAAPSAHLAAAPLHGFNFAYVAQGARDAAPTQVFDDGKRTYLQFNALDRVPEIWTDDERGRGASRRLAAHLESPYIVVDQVVPRLRLVLEGQNTLLVNQGWKAVRTAVRPAVAPRVWSDSTPFGPIEPPGPIASVREAAPSHERLPPVAAPARRREDSDAQLAEGPPGEGAPAVSDEPNEVALAPPLDARAAEAMIEERQRLAAGSLIDARLELLRRAATELLEQSRRENNLAAAQSIQLTLDTIIQAQGKLLLSQKTPGPPVPDKHAPSRGPLIAMADTRLRTDIEVRDDLLHDGVLRPDAAAALTPGELPSGRSEPGLAATASPLQRSRGDHAGAGVPLVFEVRDNQRLSQALAHFLETQGWRLEWESASDFVVRRGYTVRGDSLKQVLLDALGEYRLSAVLYGGNLVVAVSGGDR